ncbi:hypothetical protein HMI54_011902 [Coelomomyces lativittatus]|nr:hypothetical protein HMI56_001026 [Coelomomyces lativittatus]KAJ1515671.1 hypothetical protein HMI54_011902 [Coelomomyces lativittatus]KAJ1516533.1 hypothetical protein HMI55_002015 [Coelomomyces lativittatus]
MDSTTHSTALDLHSSSSGSSTPSLFTLSQTNTETLLQVTPLVLVSSSTLPSVLLLTTPTSTATSTSTGMTPTTSFITPTTETHVPTSHPHSTPLQQEKERGLHASNPLFILVWGLLGVLGTVLLGMTLVCLYRRYVSRPFFIHASMDLPHDKENIENGKKERERLKTARGRSFFQWIGFPWWGGWKQFKVHHEKGTEVVLYAMQFGFEDMEPTSNHVSVVPLYEKKKMEPTPLSSSVTCGLSSPYQEDVVHLHQWVWNLIQWTVKDSFWSGTIQVLMELGTSITHPHALHRYPCIDPATVVYPSQIFPILFKTCCSQTYPYPRTSITSWKEKKAWFMEERNRKTLEHARSNAWVTSSFQLWFKKEWDHTCQALIQKAHCSLSNALTLIHVYIYYLFHTKAFFPNSVWKVHLPWPVAPSLPSCPCDPPTWPGLFVVSKSSPTKMECLCPPLVPNVIDA